MKFGSWMKAAGIAKWQGPADTEVFHLACDSREMQPGWAFVAIPGEHVNGADYVTSACSKGAVAVLSTEPLELPEGIGFGVLACGNHREAMANAARSLYGKPDEELALIGVTGTNGKTTTTMLIRQLLQGMGKGCGLIGTVSIAAGSEEIDAVRTSPESPVFYRWLRKAADAGDVAVATEVSSHALCMARVHGARFKVGLFTNLTQDHLDYHGTMAAYFEAKCRLFDQSETTLVNLDDETGRSLAASRQTRTYAVNRTADYHAENARLTPTGTLFQLKSPFGDFNVESPLLGRFNLYNLLAALAACGEAGFDLGHVVQAVPLLKGAPGRLDRVDCGQAFGVMVDYAHTPDALEKLLAAGKDLLPPGGRLHVLFGCGGDRDRTKRPLMAAAVAAGADVIWHSSDNTRKEDPEGILNDAAVGIPTDILADSKRYHRITDRALAVQAALADCRAGDLLLLAGKGHEPYQDIMGVKHPYSDRGAVEAVLRGEIVPRTWA
ncbi:MAG: UDP-N-acetylmuramoyl-L-alanyl-D-glutamate--2,6-diaminopimelate ligase [Holophaga sp.]|nr:UDP-N-acetylmuramoyl-L-alanyl-D-glutamate--2,6-diaminopimelate ligase [Holophaga sp.]